ncbi:MAG: leucine-rich repeat domain-containing protein, partial [Candidatus Hodarchaeota archaeon]
MINCENRVFHKGEWHDVLSGTLDLSKNSIQKIKEVEGLSKLIRLKSLNLSFNNIRRIPNLGFLKDLEVLKLQNNQISNIEGLNEVSSLTLLDLSNNKISRIEGLGNLVNLRTLILSNNQIREIRPSELPRNLNVLLLDHNKISKIQGLDHLSWLRQLDLSFNKISWLMNLQYLVRLSVLSIHNNLLPPIIESILEQFKEWGGFSRKVVNFCRNPSIQERIIFQEFLDQCHNRDEKMLDEIDIWKVFAGCHYIIGNFQGSIESFENALKINPNDEMVRFYIEYIKKEQNLAKHRK